MHEPKACRSCGAPIFWGWNETTARSIPVDAEPRDDGNVLLVDRRGSVIARVLGGDDAERERASGSRLRVAHFVTCPQRDKWRKHARSRV